MASDRHSSPTLVGPQGGMRGSPDGIEPVGAHHECMTLPRANAVNALIERPPWRPVAIILEVATAVSVVVCGLYYVFLPGVFRADH